MESITPLKVPSWSKRYSITPYSCIPRLNKQITGGGGDPTASVDYCLVPAVGQWKPPLLAKRP